jgi:hypothetical protein
MFHIRRAASKDEIHQIRRLLRRPEYSKFSTLSLLYVYTYYLYTTAPSVLSYNYKGVCQLFSWFAPVATRIFLGIVDIRATDIAYVHISRSLSSGLCC